jgi:hypothetical protein
VHTRYETTTYSLFHDILVEMMKNQFVLALYVSES